MTSILSVVQINLWAPQSTASCPIHIPFTPMLYFLATLNSSLSAPVLYFAELYNGGEEDIPSLCCCVDVPTLFSGMVFIMHNFLYHCISFLSRR
jgi:hypothetical protein